MIRNENPRYRKFTSGAAAVLILVAVLRIVATYKSTSVAWDEPCHIAAGLEWVDKHTYTLDPIHPPLSRTAIGLPLYLAGERIPSFDGPLRKHDYYEVGGRILYDGGHYNRNLTLARSGVLPFFIVLAVFVFCWTRSLFGDVAGLLATVLFTTIPSILAFSGLAYTDITTACTQFAALFAFARWLQWPTRSRTLVFGLALGLAFLSKMTTLLFVPAAAAGIVACWCSVKRFRAAGPGQEPRTGLRHHWVSAGLVVAAVSLLVLWGGYRFSVGHVQEAMGLSPESMPTFQRFPGPLRSLAQRAVVDNWAVPAPALIQGLSVAWVVNQMHLPSFMFDKVTTGGIWYFFFVALAVKAPLPLLCLWVIGICSVIGTAARAFEWEPLAPAIAPVMILLVAIAIHYKEGVRHILVVFALLAVVAAQGWIALWNTPGNWRWLGRTAVVVLLSWQCVSSLRASPDFLSYYNALAGRDPARVYMTGCDLDCGQDVFRLAEETRKRGISQLNIAIWSAADIHQMGLPPVQILQPFQPVTGWVAISLRSQRLGHLFHTAYPPAAFAWLDRYTPVQRVGNTILLYWIPGDAVSPPSAPR